MLSMMFEADLRPVCSKCGKHAQTMSVPVNWGRESRDTGQEVFGKPVIEVKYTCPNCGNERN